MANRDAPYGLQYNTINRGYPPVHGVFKKLAAYGTALFENDVVYGVLGASGSENKQAIQAWASATPGTTIPLGVCRNYAPASQASRHEVIVDKDAEYHCQDNNDTDGVAVGDIGKRGNIEAGAGSATTGYSGHELDESTLHASAYRDVLVKALYPDPLNAFGANARVIVKFISLQEEPIT